MGECRHQDGVTGRDPSIGDRPVEVDRDRGAEQVHNALEAAAVRTIEVASALTFQAPERLLLGVTQAANALFTTLGESGNVRTALGAVSASVTTTVNESVDLVRHALKEPIPISPAAAATATHATKSAVAKIGAHKAMRPVRRASAGPRR